MSARLLLCAALAPCVLGGCASEVVQRGPEQVWNGQGGAWEVVMAPGQPEAGWETARLDESLNVRAQELADRDRPSLEHPRRIYLSRRADDVLYFVPHHHRRWSY